ncbi:DNA replication/repair protein RecF [Gemmiger formicilis]|uniref:DNA replication/repair protein RecF n=1 Tax=Gemmiger formicilis TaxID=745368 RepID=UPI00195A3443|nr:DNA replication/repair protein RecF [Gemmiger formicilis]MBM6717844.1 DNA replication/repair protein RecF [Gemmiger formicilis]
MRLDHLKVEQFRNLESAELNPAPRLTVLCGANGQGKTNLLESIWLLTGAKSFRGAKDAELIRRDQGFAVIEADFEGGGRDQALRLTVGSKQSERPGRRARLNGADRGRASAVAGTFTAVVFDPNHLSLVKAGPEGRRHFLDAALCQLFPGYLAALRRYARLTAQKNALLKAYDITPGGDVLLETYNEAMAQCGAEVMGRRAQYLDRLAPLAEANYRDISSGAEALGVRYMPCCEPGDPQALAARLREVRPQELRAGFCLTGPHREDLEILIDGQPGKIYGSQGQQRSAVLALKLAEASVAGEVLGEHPVMLLDDVLSELDDARQTYLLTRIEDKQTFVTTCDSAAFARTNGKLVFVEGGRVREG